MPAISVGALAELRRRMAEGEHPDWGKVEINAALQAIQSWFDSNQQSLSQAINAGTTHSFSPVQKKKLVAYWLLYRFGEEI